MGRFRITPPLGLEDPPTFITCEKAKEDRLAEFRRRLEYVLASFQLSVQSVDFNGSLARLKRTVKHGRKTCDRGDRVHPIIEIIINHRAQMYAEKRTGDERADLIQVDIEKAAAWVACNVSPFRGRPRAQLLDHHVAGLMALIQHFTGTPVLASRHKGMAKYEPALVGAARVLLCLREVDSTITETQLVNKVCQIRREYAGRPMRFCEFYPLYGATPDRHGQPVLAPPFRLESLERSVPIYCP